MLFWVSKITRHRKHAMNADPLVWLINKGKLKKTFSLSTVQGRFIARGLYHQGAT